MPGYLGFTLLASLLSAVIFGTAPALRAARIEPNAALKGGRGASQLPVSESAWQGARGGASCALSAAVGRGGTLCAHA